MFFPEGLYTLSARDRQVTWLDPVLFHSSSSVAAGTVTVDYTVPEGRILLLQTATVEAVSGAAQTVSWLAVVARPVSSAVPYVTFAGEWTTGAPANRFVNWSGAIAVAPGWLIQGSAIFNAGAAANAVGLALLGLLIPSGNIQRV